MTRSEAIIVTGSTGGLGAATVERFRTAGYTVYGFDRGEPDGGSPAGPGEQNPFIPLQVDVSDDDNVRTAVERVADEAAVVGLVHCAGIAEFGPDRPGHLISPSTGAVLDNLATIQRTLRVNLEGTFTVVRHVASAMASQAEKGEGRGFIVLTSSGAALEGKAGQTAYSASKSGVIGMTLPLARELSPFGIRVVTIAPGLFDTPILAHTPRLERHVPFPNRMGEPREFAALAQHISENPYINAEVIRIDGGIRGGFESATPFVR